MRLPAPAQGRRALSDRRPASRLLGGEEGEGRLHPLAHFLLLGEIELEEDRVDVLLDPALGQEKRLGDRAVALSLRDLGQHLALAWGEPGEGRAFRAARRAQERVHHGGVDHRPAVRHGRDRRDQLRPIVDALLQQIAAAFGARVKERKRVARLGVLAEDEDADSGVSLAQPRRHLDAFVGLRGRHADVRQDDVRPLGLDRIEERVEVVARGHNLDRAVRREHLLEALAHEQAVVCKGYTDRHGVHDSSPTGPLSCVHHLDTPACVIAARARRDDGSKREAAGKTRRHHAMSTSSKYHLSAPVGVLTVDDQAVFRRVAREVIEATEGFEVLGEASSGEEALQLAETVEPDLFLVDVRMPGIDGPETARRLVAARPESVVVLVSTEDPSAISSAAGSCGAVELIRKEDFAPATLQRLWISHGPAARHPSAV